MVEGSGKVVLKQLFPAKSERLEVDGKREWMDAAVLWSGSTQKVEVPSIGREGENGGRKSGPFDVDRMARSVPGSIRTPLPYHSLEVPLVAPAVMGSNCGEANRSLGLRSSRRLVGGVALEFPSTKVDRQQQQATRKARRCWSRELHRKFESALEQLGGPDVATPKQIREVMKVEGLTNDEVKSHLQKYRIHSKKMSPAVKLDLHLKTSPVYSPNSPLELSHFGASWIGHRPGSCGYESTIDRCNGEVSG